MDSERDNRLADAMAEYTRRRALGESPDPAEYRAVLGDAYTDFLEILEASAAVTNVVEPFAAPSLPYRFGRYTLTRRLGQGAMGVVFEALDEQLGRAVALKVLRTGFDLDGSSVGRFLREARACSQVKHPAIVTVHDAGTCEGRLYYTMDVVPGGSLAARVRSQDLPPIDALLRGFADVADALHALHSHKPAPIIHRDVKPSNLILQDDGKMVLADFGLARTAASESLTRTGDALGTPLYMSPEQAGGQPALIDARSDVYGLGATIWEAITGKPPFAGQDLSELLMKIQMERPGSLGAKGEVPEGLEDVLLKALEKRREDRYESAAALRDDLLRIADGKSPRGGPVSPVKRAVRWASRRVPAFALLLAALLTGAWFITNRSGAVVFKMPGGWEVELQDGRRFPSTEVVSLSPGRYTATAVVPAGYEADVVMDQKSFDVPPGETRAVEFVVERVTLRGARLLLERYEASLPKIPLGTSRGGSDRVIAWPRGEVRAEDLDRFAVAMAPDDPPDLPRILRFQGTGGRALGEVSFTPTESFHEAPIPAEIRAAIRSGDRVRMVLVVGGRDTVSAIFQVVEGSAATAGLKDLEARIAPLDEATKSAARARYLLAAGLPGPALRAAHSVPIAKRSLAVWGVLASAGYALDVESETVLEGAYEHLDRRKKADPAAYDAIFVPAPK